MISVKGHHWWSVRSSSATFCLQSSEPTPGFSDFLKIYIHRFWNKNQQNVCRISSTSVAVVQLFATFSFRPPSFTYLYFINIHIDLLSNIKFQIYYRLKIHNLQCQFWKKKASFSFLNWGKPPSWIENCRVSRKLHFLSNVI